MLVDVVDHDAVKLASANRLCLLNVVDSVCSAFTADFADADPAVVFVEIFVKMKVVPAMVGWRT